MIEFVIAILVVVIITSGIVQFVELAGERGALAAQIRREAGEQALGHRAATIVRPDYILGWDEGPDGIRHTADDVRKTGQAGGTLQVGVVDRSVRQNDDWRILDDSRNAAFPSLHHSSLPLSALGFVHAGMREKIVLDKVMREWLLGKDTATVGADLWFPKLALEGFDP